MRGGDDDEGVVLCHAGAAAGSDFVFYSAEFQFQTFKQAPDSMLRIITATLWNSRGLLQEDARASMKGGL